MEKLTFDARPIYEAYVSDVGYICITSECLECGRESTFAIPPEVFKEMVIYLNKESDFLESK